VKYQWSIAFEGLTTFTDGPFKLISIKSFKLCAVIDDLKLFLITFILLNPHSQATVDTGITETMDIWILIFLTEESYHLWLELYLKAC
jgi:hypothetical protein